jgi:iron complex outermembrane receptor protein
MTSRHTPRPHPLFTALLLAGCCSASLAQTAPAPPASAPEAETPKVEIKARAQKKTATSPVDGYAARRAATATKTDALLGETPASVTVVTQEQITDLGATNLQEVLNYAAGLRSSNYGVDSRGDWTRIRGAEPVQYLDGLQLMFGFNNNARIEPFSLERIDVLRGPASVLYGQGSTGGLINMVSKRPLDMAQNQIGLQLGSFNRVQIEGDFTGPFNQDKTWLYRLVVMGRESDTQVDYVPDDMALVAPSLTWAPDAMTRWTLQAHWQRNASGSSATFLPWSGTVLPNPNGQIPTRRFVGEPGFDAYDTTRNSLASLFEHRFDNGWLVTQSTRWTYSTGDYKTLYPSSNFADPANPYLNPEQSLIGRYVYGNQRNTHSFQADQNLLGTVMTGSVQHQLLFGLDYSRYSETARSAFDIGTDLDVFAPVYGNFTPPAWTPDARLVQQQTGLYAQDQMKFNQDWLLMLGLRQDWFSNDLEDQTIERDHATTGRAALMYLGFMGWSPYLSYSESFMPIAGTDFFGERYVPTRGEQWEAGVKYQTEDGRFVANGAVYTLTEKNRQVNDPSNPLNQLQTGESKTQGVELEAKGRITRSFDLIANYTYTDVDAVLEQLPKNLVSVWGTWRFALGGLGGFSAGLGVRHASAFTDGFAPETPSVTLADGLLAYDTRDWRVALNATNLFDKTYVSTCLSRGDCWWGARRNLVATVSYKF